MKHLNKIASVFCAAALGMLALTSCEGGDLYKMDAPDWIAGKVDSINDADKTVVIDADGIFLTFERMAIRRVLPTAATPAKDVEANEAKEEKVESEEKIADESTKAEEKTDSNSEENK